jgi:phosphomevalonate kinase
MTLCAIAPGKLLLSGAYVVLGDAPAIVCAVNRHARASSGDGPMTAEVREALEQPCAIDVSELESSGQKLGLGSSAAALVAALALRADEQGEDVSTAEVRDRIFERARVVHARVQGGGSGVDVAASTYGGVLRFQRGKSRPVSLPPGVSITAFFSGTSVRTSALRERVAALAERDPERYVARMGVLAAVSVAASDAIEAADGPLFVSAIGAHLGALKSLGEAVDAPIVPAAFAELAGVAPDEGAAFIPSGAGGGDVGVFVGMASPSASFMKHAERHSMTHIPLDIDSRGVRIERR